MAVTVKIPTQLRAVTGGVSEASVEGTTVAEVLDGLFAQFGELRERISDEQGAQRPLFGELRERISDEQGALRRFVNVYLAGEDIRFLDGVATSVPDGAELTILPAVAGG